jgi:hypothetical protein
MIERNDTGTLVTYNFSHSFLRLKVIYTNEAPPARSVWPPHLNPTPDGWSGKKR